MTPVFVCLLVCLCSPRSAQDARVGAAVHAFDAALAAGDGARVSAAVRAWNVALAHSRAPPAGGGGGGARAPGAVAGPSGASHANNSGIVVSWRPRGGGTGAAAASGGDQSLRPVDRAADCADLGRFCDGDCDTLFRSFLAVEPGTEWLLHVECLGGAASLSVDGDTVVEARAAGRVPGSSVSGTPLGPGSHLWELVFSPGPGEAVRSVHVRWTRVGGETQEIPSDSFALLPAPSGLAALDPEGGGGVDARRSARVVASLTEQAAATAALAERGTGPAESALPGLRVAWWRPSRWPWAPRFEALPPAGARLAPPSGLARMAASTCLRRVPPDVDSLSLTGVSLHWPDTAVYAAFSGYLTVPRAGRWTFHRQTGAGRGGSRVSIDGMPVGDNEPEEGEAAAAGARPPAGADGAWGEESCTLSLDAGAHALRVELLLRPPARERRLLVEWSGPGTTRGPLPPGVLAQNTADGRLRNALYIHAIGARTRAIWYFVCCLRACLFVCLFVSLFVCVVCVFFVVL